MITGRRPKRSVIGPTSTTTFQIRLDATASGTPGGTLSFDTNDGDENPFNFTIQGTGSGTDSGTGTQIEDKVLIESTDGDISITGQSNATGFENPGVEILSGSTVRSNGTTADAATITINGCFAIHNMKIIYGEERGLFVSMPAVQRNGRYQDIAHPITPEFRDEMEKAVIAEYEAELARNGGGD